MESAIIKLELNVPAVSCAPSDALADALRQIKDFGKRIAAVESEIKAEITSRLEDQQPVPGWALQVRDGTRQVADVSELYQWWCDEGLSPTEFVKLAKPAVTKLSKRYAELMAEKSGAKKTHSEARFRIATEDANLVVIGDDVTALVQLKPRKDNDNA